MGPWLFALQHLPTGNLENGNNATLSRILSNKAGFFDRIARIWPNYLLPCITIVCLVGIYSVRNSIFDVLVMLAAGVLGYFLRHLALPVAPFIIGMVLGLTTEASSRQTVVLFRGNMLLIFERPVAAGFWS